VSAEGEGGVGERKRRGKKGLKGQVTNEGGTSGAGQGVLGVVVSPPLKVPGGTPLGRTRNRRTPPPPSRKQANLNDAGQGCSKET